MIPAIEEDAPRTEISAEDTAAVSALPEGNALLIVTRGPDVGARYLLDQQQTTAGRSPDCDIFLDDITVSRHHARFDMVGGEVRITDLGSLNGTYVNRTLVDGSAVLRPGEEVQIGKFRMVFFVSEHGLR
ncbi:Inner membrane component of T3SS domain-containing protein [Propionibacterium cyclohexanicum]|uniref:Inner membrane component of T3SS domain-containing protein n=1 Tax=Propionibacterium cyclohexanicum TaxID=64702 RepID=A0A1H9QMQ1_9ACTN|nr:Inner membrane component of T3SS domain-containing protein [Propionibacterium cyclohexanicum]